MDSNLLLWHITLKENWEEHQKQGVIRAKQKWIFEQFEELESDKLFLEAYEWMRFQMYQRIKVKPYSSEAYPVWAWYQYTNDKRRMPDLRRVNHLGAGAKGVRIAFRMNPKDVLLSDFDLWHYAYSSTKFFIGDSEKEEERVWKEIEEELEKTCGTLNKHPSYYYPRAVAERIEKSWEKIFDMDFKHWDSIFMNYQKRIQATMWEIPLDNIIEVREFVAR